MLGICVLLKLSYYLVNGQHAMLADGHKNARNLGCVISFKYQCLEIYAILNAALELATHLERTEHLGWSDLSSVNTDGGQGTYKTCTSL